MGDMITDKGIFDAVWCPILWLDSDNNRNRLKPDRNYDPLESIHHALSIGKSTPYVCVEDIPGGRRVVPHNESLWLHIPFREGKFLITAKEINWTGLFSSEKRLELIRIWRFDPRDSDAVLGEMQLQRLVLKRLRNFFQDTKMITVISSFPTVDRMETSSPSDQEISEAEQWATKIYDQKEGYIELSPRHDKCSQCWWKTCSSRKVHTPVQGVSFKEGKRARGVFD